MIVGLAGAAGAGKDSAAKGLIEEKGYRKISFAARLKQMLCDLFGWKYERWDDLEWKETPNEQSYGLTPRQVAQSFGTDWGRDMINPNIWVDATMRVMSDEQQSSGANHVITDIRFPNEAKAIREAGGVIIFITCRDRATGTESTGHESEAWLPWLYTYADCEIAANFGQIDELKEGLLNVVENYENGGTPRYETQDAETQEMLDAIECGIRKTLQLPTNCRRPNAEGATKVLRRT